MQLHKICLQLILNAKCHAIRDAQLLEKNQITKEMADEERRLDTMMEVSSHEHVTIHAVITVNNNPPNDQHLVLLSSQ